MEAFRKGQSMGFEGCISRAIWFDVLLRLLLVMLVGTS
jgi:hypothetical protein